MAKPLRNQSQNAAEKRRSEAIRAALDVAREVGVQVDRPAILSDSNNTIVDLSPSRVVAKVATSSFRHAKLESMEREVSVASFLARKGAPVVAPAMDIGPGPYRRDDAPISLWQ